MSRILLIMLKDGLMFPSGNIAEASYRCLIYCKIPEDWLEGEVPESNELWLKGPQLKADKLEDLFEAFYGKTWRMGNSDGSQYVVGTTAQRLLNPLQMHEKPWQYDDPSNKQFRYFYFVVDTNGQFKSASPSELE